LTSLISNAIVLTEPLNLTKEKVMQLVSFLLVFAGGVACCFCLMKFFGYERKKYRLWAPNGKCEREWMIQSESFNRSELERQAKSLNESMAQGFEYMKYFVLADNEFPSDPRFGLWIGSWMKK